MRRNLQEAPLSPHSLEKTPLRMSVIGSEGGSDFGGLGGGLGGLGGACLGGLEVSELAGGAGGAGETGLGSACLALHLLAGLDAR